MQDADPTRLQRVARDHGLDLLPTPEPLAGYYRHAVVGRGGQGSVYLATRDEGGRYQHCALKVFSGPLGDDDRRRIARSLDIQAGFARDWAPSILDADVDAAAPWVAQSWAGLSLSEVLRSQRPGRALSTRFDVLRKLARALQVLHRLGVTHRDVKPSNVLISPPYGGGFARVVLCDFDLARQGDLATITATGAVMGTLLYMAPEQWLGRRATSASDVYSFAVTALEVLTGDTQVEARLPGGVPAAGPVQLPPHARAALVRPELADWMEAALRADPEARPDRLPVDPLWHVERDLRRQERQTARDRHWSTADPSAGVTHRGGGSARGFG
ncbi:serine/threonine-protein kinase [Nocardioides sp. OK12]|uniref:serine/threonine-protein kinase n=1 Tax=Nocardioides sp. OK12 TaxID=2758661 RepID=UPI0021C38ED7|nr:serine/threonine-protein kinase [Nocardioides sp. OK12]